MPEQFTQEQNGSRWLHELTYGTEKQLQLLDLKKSLKDQSPRDVISQKDELNKREFKLSRSKSGLALLVGSEVTVRLIALEEDRDVIDGRVSGFNLAEGHLAIKHSDGTTVVPYCAIEPHEEFTRTIIPTVTLLTDQVCKY